MPRLWSVRSWMSAIALVSSTIASPGLMAQQTSLMPLPAHLTQESGQFSIDGGFRVVFEGYTEPPAWNVPSIAFSPTWHAKTGILPFPSRRPHSLYSPSARPRPAPPSSSLAKTSPTT